jgi:mRNA interferase RelE/StbE
VGKYRILIKPSAVKELERIPSKDRSRIVYRIQGLVEEPWPRGCEKLSAQERYRIRQGNYRILYEVRDDDLIVVVVKVGQRGEVHKKR